jgi:hypothetical protein
MDKVFRIECTVKAASDERAKRIFHLACRRLLNVHDWTRLSDCLLSASDHRDFYGAEVSRSVRTDDYINLTNQSLRPFGWMHVLFVAENEEENGGEVALLARPVKLPFHPDNESQIEAKPALLRVVRKGLDVTAGFVMEGNPVATVFERLGVYAIQWRSLVNGILGDLTPVLERQLTDPIETGSRFA